MIKRHIVGLMFILAIGARAEAATVSLVPSSSTVAENTGFTVDLVMNAVDALGSHPGVFSGEIVIDFDALLLTYGSFTPAAAVSVFSGPTVTTMGNQRSVTLGYQSTSDNGIMGSFSFTAIGSPNSIAQIGIADADDFSSSFVNELPDNHGFDPIFTGTSVTIAAIPLPGAGWLLLTGAGLIGLRARPRTCRASRKDA